MSRLSRFLSRILASASGNVETTADLAQILSRGYDTDSGTTVTYDSAMRTSDVYKCVRVISEDMAKLPLNIYKRQLRGKLSARDYFLEDLFIEPNPFQTGYEFRETMQSHLELAGNAYALKTVVRNETRELIPIPPSRVRITIDYAAWKLIYHCTLPDGSELTVPAERMFHLKGLSLDGFTGVSTIRYQREAIGLGIQLVKHGARLFKNGAAIGGVLEHPAKLSDPAYERLRSSFDADYAGVDNAHKTILLEEGTKFSKTGMTADDAQFLESRKFSRTDIAGLFRVPPHKIGDLERATFSNIEQQSIEYGTDSLMPRCRRWEDRIRRDLVPVRDRSTYFAEHDLKGLLRGDYAARTAGYQSAIAAGWMNRNEPRELENMNPVDGLDEFLVPLNMVLVGQEPPPAPAPAPKEPAP